MTDRGLRLFGHRGASAHHPENTLEAFQRALDDGANALETDVHATADGHFVTAHDPDGERVAGDPSQIRRLSLDEVRRWSLRSPDGRPSRSVVPTLAEVLEAFPGVPVSVDLKEDDPNLVAPLIDCVRAAGAEERVILGSFHDRLLYRMRRLGWRGPILLTKPEIAALRVLPGAIARRLVRGTSMQVPRRAVGIALDHPAFARRCREFGLRLEYWTINSPDEARDLLDRGAMGIMTDDPAALRPVFEDFGY